MLENTLVEDQKYQICGIYKIRVPSIGFVTSKVGTIMIKN